MKMQKIKDYLYIKPMWFLTLCTLVTTCVLAFYITSDKMPDPSAIIGIALLDGVFVSALTIPLIYKTFARLKRNKKTGYKLQRNIILFFSCLSALPLIISTVFFIYFFYKGLDTWFDRRVTRAFDQAFNIASVYIEENISNLKESAFYVSEQINNINTQSEMQIILDDIISSRHLTEAMVFNIATKEVVAQSGLSFSIVFSTISSGDVEIADLKGFVVKKDKSSIKILMKLLNKPNEYLLIGKVLDKTIVEYLSNTSSANYIYDKLRNNINNLHFKFSLLFILIALTLIIVNISLGDMFSRTIALKLNKLLQGTFKVSEGDFNTYIDIPQDEADELYILGFNFNKMVRKLRMQSTELTVAQKAMLWSDIARRVAHEIKNPLTPIQLSSELLLKKFKDEVQDKEKFASYINNILRNSADISSIVNEFSKFAKLPNPNFVSIDIISLLKEIIHSKSFLNPKVKYEIFSNKDTFYFSCDPKQIHQVINNLIKNSEEAIDVDTLSPKIITTINIQPRDVKIMIMDNGAGIQENILNKLTQPYITTRKYGMGLGLAIVKKIIEEHHGHIKVYNLTKEKGACVEITFEYNKS